MSGAVSIETPVLRRFADGQLLNLSKLVIESACSPLSSCRRVRSLATRRFCAAMIDWVLLPRWSFWIRQKRRVSF